MRSIADELRQSLDRLTPTERKPAHALLADYPIAGLETVAQFAERAGVSGATILRLIAKLGFSGYAEFQQVLRDELQLRLRSPLNWQEGEREAAASGADLLDRFAQSAAETLQQSLRELPRAEFEAALGLLADERRRVLLLGGRFTDPLAVYLYLHLREMRPLVQHVGGQSETWPEHLLDAGKRDVLVVFDIRRYQPDVVAFAEQAARQGVNLVLFTDQWLSPIARVARHVLSVRVDAPSNWDSNVAMLTLVEALVAALNNRFWARVRQRIERLEQIRGGLKRD